MNMNQMYKFEVFSAELKPLEFDELIVDFQEFESEPLDMGDIPAGFSGFELPTLGFDLIFYNKRSRRFILILGDLLVIPFAIIISCLLYTSDAADE